MRDRTLFSFALVILWGTSGAMADPCSDFSPQRRPYFGDTHIHTRYSQDANWRMGSSQTTPEDAYRFAKGEPISLPPYDAAGNSLRSLQIQRALDFAVVTDHAESMDVVRICDDPSSPGHKSWICRKNQMLVAAAQLAGRYIPGVEVLCAVGSPECTAATVAVWQDTIEAAQQHNEECDFTAFIGYEWSGINGGSNMHRNVVFRTDDVIEKPISALDEFHVEGLWQALDVQCRDAAIDCEAITIPHNSNLSEGKMFSARMGDGQLMTDAVIRQRSRYERLAEIVQHKGASECYYGPEFSADELCSFEQLPYSNFFGKYFEPLREPPANDSRYLREALREGLRLENTMGHNPFVPGFIGSTDTHIAAPGAVEENNYGGNHGAQVIKGRGEQPQLPDRVEQNAGGLAVLYAAENTRDALFAAMQRREAYGTSGTRIQLRFFGGWNYPATLCEQPDLVSQAYAAGVPMGGVLPTMESASNAPMFVVSAAQDVGTEQLNGTALQRIQVIKGWVDSDGSSRETVYDIAGNAENGSSVDLNTCEAIGEGAQRLCSVWRDPEFDAGSNAFYYARVVENPSCRWQQHICVANAVNCASPDTVPEGLEGCCDASVPKTIQERAWSSAIWYRQPADED
ncbi:MAG: DUF3604 domain-containing protein [Halioglobus sp.]